MVFFVGGNEITHFHVGLFLSSGNGFSRRGGGVQDSIFLMKIWNISLIGNWNISEVILHCQLCDVLPEAPPTFIWVHLLMLLVVLNSFTLVKL